MLKNCLICSTQFYTRPSSIKMGQGLYCNRQCRGKSMVGGISPHRKDAEDIAYAAKHWWVKKMWGRPTKCEVCDTETAKWYEWANLDHKYNLKRKDWKRMCRSCHTKHDLINGLRRSRWVGIKSK